LPAPPDLSEASVAGGLLSEFTIIKILAAKLLQGIVRVHPDVFPNEVIAERLSDFLPECPTNSVSKTFQIMVKDSPELVITRAEFVVGNLLRLLDYHMGQMVSDDVDDAAKDDLEMATCSELGLLSAFIKDLPRAADEMVPVISLWLTSDISEWDNVYDSICGVLLSTF
jgi:hypothetical protein